MQATLERRVGSNAWLVMALAEGKNREVRRLLAHLGLSVTRLIRIAYGPFQLGKLKPGAVAEVPAKALHEQLGHLLPGAGGQASPRPSAGRKSHRPRPAGPGSAGRTLPPTGRKRHAHPRRPS